MCAHRRERTSRRELRFILPVTLPTERLVGVAVSRLVVLLILHA